MLDRFKQCVTLTAVTLSFNIIVAIYFVSSRHLCTISLAHLTCDSNCFRIYALLCLWAPSSTLSFQWSSQTSPDSSVMRRCLNLLQSGNLTCIQIKDMCALGLATSMLCFEKGVPIKCIRHALICVTNHTRWAQGWYSVHHKTSHAVCDRCTSNLSAVTIMVYQNQTRQT